jgi:hypothetical protein
MAVVVYKCDTCKREVELIQNLTGLEVMSRCMITNGCKGKLLQTAVKPSYIRGKLPDPDPSGLKDWIPRRAYFKQEQKTALRTWKVQHDLGTNPSIQVHINLVDGTMIDTTDYEYSYTSPFELSVVFPEARSGIVQCFARSSVTDEKREVILTQAPEVVSKLLITGSSVLTLAVPPAPYDLSGLKIGFISSVSGGIVYHQPITFTTQTSATSPWWKQQIGGTGINKVYFSGKNWDVRTARIDDDILMNSSIIDGSPFFFTNKKVYDITDASVYGNTFTVSATLDINLLPEKVLNVINSSWNNGVYHITSSTINVNGTTTIQVVEPIPNVLDDGAVTVDYPVDSPIMYVLLAHEPYSLYDKDFTTILNINRLSYNSALVTSQVKGQLYVQADQTQIVYPPIIV